MKNILLIVDIQNGFIECDENCCVAKKIERLLEINIFDAVIASKYQNHENSNIIKLMGWKKLISSEEQELPEYLRNAADYIVLKNGYSAYLDSTVKALKEINSGSIPEYIFIVGVNTDCCILSTAVDFFEAGIRPIVLTNYCATSGGSEYHKAGIMCMQNLVGGNNLIERDIFGYADLIEIIHRYN